MYKAIIEKISENKFYALVGFEDGDEKRIVRFYKGRYFKTLKAAEKSTAAYISAIS